MLETETQGDEEITIEIVSGTSDLLTDLDEAPHVDSTVRLKGKESKDDPRFEEFKNLAGGRWDDNRNVVKTYIDGLEKRNDSKSHFLLAKALKNGAPGTQHMVCEALSRMGGEAVDVLVENL